MDLDTFKHLHSAPAADDEYCLTYPLSLLLINIELLVSNYNERALPLRVRILQLMQCTVAPKNFKFLHE